MTRPITVIATDEHCEVEGQGTIVQAGRDWRPTLRVLLTLAGVLAMVAGTFGTWDRYRDLTAMELTTRRLIRLFTNPDVPMQLVVRGTDILPYLNPISLGILILIGAALTAFGLTGSTGRLTRLSTILTAVVVGASLVTFTQVPGNAGAVIGNGALLVLAGCLAAYIGGKFVRN